MKKWMKRSLLAAFAAVLVFSAVSFQTQAKDGRTIEKGIFAKEIDLSGMTVEQATDAIEDYINELSGTEITLMGVKGGETVITAGDIGLTWTNREIVEQAAALGKEGTMIARYKALKDLQQNNMVYDIDLDIDMAALKLLLEEQCRQFDVPAVNASLSRVDGEFVIEEGQTGMKLDVEKSAEVIRDYLRNDWNGENETIDLVVIMDEPEGSAETLAKVKDVLGTCTTSFSSSNANRSGNIATGCKHINGSTIYPGEMFSVGDAVTPFSTANGYYMAGSYLNGQVVDSLGGGICQVSTTLYNAVLGAELQVDERSNHSMIVSYVEPSADAAIAVDSGKDLKFTNNTDYPIYIEGIIENKTITFTIYGVETRDPNREVRYESVVLEKNVPDYEVIHTNAGAPIGSVVTQSAHIGYKAQLWKVVTVDGVEVERTQVNSSNYKATPRQATVGTATSDPNSYNILMAAIATNDINHVKEVATGLALAAQQAAQPAPVDPAVPVVPTDPAAVPVAPTDPNVPAATETIPVPDPNAALPQ